MTDNELAAIRAAQCPDCNGRGGWYDPDEGIWVSCIRCAGTGTVGEAQSE